MQNILRDFHCYPDGTLQMLPWQEDKFVDRLTYNITQPLAVGGVILAALIAEHMGHQKIQVVPAKISIEEIKCYYLSNLS